MSGIASGKLLKSARAYRSWATGKDGWDTYKDRWPVCAPTEYPCFGYTAVSSFGYEEESPLYLYAADLEIMIRELREATP